MDIWVTRLSEPPRLGVMRRFQRVNEAPRRLVVALDQESDDAAEAVHLLFCQLVARCAAGGRERGGIGGAGSTVAADAGMSVARRRRQNFPRDRRPSPAGAGGAPWPRRTGCGRTAATRPLAPPPSGGISRVIASRRERVAWSKRKLPSEYAMTPPCQRSMSCVTCGWWPRIAAAPHRRQAGGR